MVANDPRFPGPAALNRLFTLEEDSRDVGHAERAAVMLSEDALTRCHTQANCTDVCPMEISPTQSILALRRRAARRLLAEKRHPRMSAAWGSAGAIEAPADEKLEELNECPLSAASSASTPVARPPPRACWRRKPWWPSSITARSSPGIAWWSRAGTSRRSSTCPAERVPARSSCWCSGSPRRWSAGSAPTASSTPSTTGSARACRTCTCTSSRGARRTASKASSGRATRTLARPRCAPSATASRARSKRGARRGGVSPPRRGQRPARCSAGRARPRG